MARYFASGLVWFRGAAVPVAPTTHCTIGCFMRTSAETGEYQNIFQNGNGVSNSYKNMNFMFSETAGQMEFAWTSGGGGFNTNSKTYVATNGIWRHVCFSITYADSSGIFYDDGVGGAVTPYTPAAPDTGIVDYCFIGAAGV